MKRVFILPIRLERHGLLERDAENSFLAGDAVPISSRGCGPYIKWFDRLNVAAAVKVTTAIHRMEQGNFSNVKGVGAGVYEDRIDFGPGYRIYFGKDGDRLVILLAGGTKKRQHADIAAAKGHWRNYKRRKQQELT